MFERFNVAARRVVILAQDEARKLNHHQLDAHHLLLGLLLEHDSVAARALTDLGVGYDAVLARVEESLGRGAEPASGHMPFTEAAQRTMQNSFEESLGLGHDYIGPEHILLAMFRGESDTTRMLADMGADAQRVREQVLGSLG